MAQKYIFFFLNEFWFHRNLVLAIGIRNSIIKEKKNIYSIFLLKLRLGKHILYRVIYYAGRVSSRYIYRQRWSMGIPMNV